MHTERAKLGAGTKSGCAAVSNTRVGKPREIRGVQSPNQCDRCETLILG